MPKQAIVVGAGLSGLASAYALSDLGFEVRVLERSERLRVGGAGLSLWPNAVRALREIGLGEVIDAATSPLEEAVTLAPSGRVITRVPLDRITRRFGPLVSAHRGDLITAFAERLGVPVEFGVTVTGEAEIRADPHRGGADLVVGADGMSSVVRESVAPGIEPRAAGYAAWRGVVAIPETPVTGASETIGRGKRFGLIPLRGGRLYWFAVVVGGSPDLDLATAFADWHEPIPTVLAATAMEPRLYLPIHDLPRLPRWHRDRVVLVGDAAHGMTPNLGQGAAQSFEDVAVLALELRALPIAEALRAYEKARKRRAERIARQSRTMGRIFQASNPAAAWLRDAVASRTPAAVTARQLAGVLSR